MNAKKKYPDQIHYSKNIPGDSGNYDWAVSFDFSQGYVGINQIQNGNKAEDRVLLSAKQVEALIAFWQQHS